MKSTALPSWVYGNPENIIDGLIALRKRREQQADKPKSARKDDYYRQSRSIQIKEMVRLAKKNGGSSID